MLSVKNAMEISIKVIKDGCLENGAIVASNSTKIFYPKEAKNYFYVWPRDASYVCIAADMAKITDIQENFFNWCLKRAEGFKEEGLFFEKYYINGLKALNRFQPDQTGTVLFAIWHHYKNDLKNALKFEDLISNAANGLCNKWEITHFNIVTNDLWEERYAFPDLKENFTYSLSACIKGLECANEIIPNKKWVSVVKQMRDQLKKHYTDENRSFARSYGKLIDKDIDASVLGLVYPFEIYEANNPRIISTVAEIEKKLVKKGGVYRYTSDKYDGWMYDKMKRDKGAGAWQLLKFWM